jgi:hypothetical protein
MFELFKMPHVSTRDEYGVNIRFCDGSSPVAVEEYRRQFPNLRILDRIMFSEVFKTWCQSGTRPSVRVSSERDIQQDV